MPMIKTEITLMRLEKLEAIEAAAEKLVRCKGHYHSEQNYRALAALFGVTVPDLEPLEGEGAAPVDQALMQAAGEVYAAGYNHGHLNTVDGLPYAEDAELRGRGAEVMAEFHELLNAQEVQPC